MFCRRRTDNDMPRLNTLDIRKSPWLPHDVGIIFNIIKPAGPTFSDQGHIFIQVKNIFSFSNVTLTGLDEVGNGRFRSVIKIADSAYKPFFVDPYMQRYSLIWKQAG